MPQQWVAWERHTGKPAEWHPVYDDGVLVQATKPGRVWQMLWDLDRRQGRPHADLDDDDRETVVLEGDRVPDPAAWARREP